MTRPVRMLLVAAGTACVGLGFIGMFLPVLPTTPFLLLAAACYARSSQRFYRWLMTNRWFGAILRNYREGRGLPLKQKITTLLLLWLTIGATAVFAVTSFWIRFFLLIVAVGVTIHLLKIKTFRPEKNRLRKAFSLREAPPPENGCQTGESGG
ncbi:YbaN family protein [bacterium]|nr:YbaN family protein [bacterium]